MKREIKLSEAIGKTITAISMPNYEETALIVFDDGTFSTIEIVRGYEDDVSFREGSLNVLSFSAHELVRCGIATEEELGAIRQKRNAELAEDNRRRLYAEYQRLKAKFEG